MKKVTYPGPRYEEFTYDGAGRLKTKKDRKNVTTTYTYDGLGRLTQKSYDNGAPAVTFTYDQVSPDHKGRLTTAANSADTLTWTYDLAAQVKNEVTLMEPPRARRRRRFPRVAALEDGPCRRCATHQARGADPRE